MNLRELWTIIWRRRRLLQCAIGAGAVLSVALNVLTAPVYRSSARVEITREPSRSPLTGAQIDAPPPQADNQALFTTAEIVTSRTLLAQVVTSLDRQGIPAGRQKRQSRSADEVAGKIDWLLDRVITEPIRDTRLIKISVEHTDPAIAARITNLIAENLVNYRQSQRSEWDLSLGTYMRTQAVDLRAKIDSLEQQTRGSNRSGLFALEEAIRQLSMTIGALNDSQTKARLQRLSISSQLAQVQSVLKSAQIDLSEIPIHTETLDALRRDLIASNTALAKAREIYGPSHPKLIALKAENDVIQRNIRQEVTSAVGNLNNERSILVGREASLRTAIAQAEEEMRSLNNRAAQFRSIEGELKSARELYNLLVSRGHEVQITGQIISPLVRIVEPAVAQRQPVRPRKVLNLAIGLLLGLLSGGGLVLFFESYRMTIRTPEEVDRHLQLPVLGLLPKESVR